MHGDTWKGQPPAVVVVPPKLAAAFVSIFPVAPAFRLKLRTVPAVTVLQLLVISVFYRPSQ